jgi:gamma-glutamyltranspeptidase/glutathione hydrolase
MKKITGIVAAGHQATAQAAREMLQAGGNAFDAALSAMLTACVAEPVLASPGGGGFLTALPADGEPIVYDFFAHTPKLRRSTEAIEFIPIVADFGTASQTFHIGMGAMATPGFIRGLYDIHKERCQLPMDLLMAPAQQLAREGVEINPFQNLIAQIVAPILKATPEALKLHASPSDPSRLIRIGESHRIVQLADFFTALLDEGADLFYRGEVAARLLEDNHALGGQLKRKDLEEYRTVRRKPLIKHYRGARLLTNPLPSLGGSLIAFALGLLESEHFKPSQLGSERHLRHLARVMRLTQLLRTDDNAPMDKILTTTVAERYRSRLQEGGITRRGTTQISVADSAGNLASLTLSNGEGCGYVIPETGIMMNNMLGEEDLNPGGFHRWPIDRRLASMMAPSLVLTSQGEALVTGSGGSNRIRSAILQVISNLLDFNLSLNDAVSHPRLHYEAGLLSLEPGIADEATQAMLDEFPEQQSWRQKSLFFGGAHSVQRLANGRLQGVGDERRGGISILADGPVWPDS